MAEMDESDFADMVEQTPVRTYVIEYREPSVDGRPGQAGRRLPQRPAERRPVDDLQLLRCRPERAQGPRHLHHPRPYHPRRARQPALRLSRLLGRGLAAHGLQDAASGRWSASAATAGGGWTSESSQRELRRLARRDQRSPTRRRARAPPADRAHKEKGGAPRRPAFPFTPLWKLLRDRGLRLGLVSTSSGSRST